MRKTARRHEGAEARRGSLRRGRQSEPATKRRWAGGAALFVTLMLSGAPAWADAWDVVSELLDSVGVDARDVGIREDELTLMAGSRPRTPLVQMVMHEPLRADALAEVIGTLLVTNTKEHPVAVLATLSRYNGRTLRRGLIGDPVAGPRAKAQEPGALLDALRAVGGQRIDAEALERVPESVRQAAALLLHAMADAEPWVERTRALTGDRRWWLRLDRELREPLPAPGEERTPDAEYQLEYKRAVEAFPTQTIAVAAQDLAFALVAAREILQADATLGEQRFKLVVSTRLGDVALCGAADDEHDYRGPVALILDTGGDDTYSQAGGNHDLEHPLSLALDLAGDDLYQAPPERFAAFGAGVLGVGLLWDEAGNDVYDADRRTQGCGVFGVGMLMDRAGADTYRAISDAQGHATAGYGALLDLAGNDHYTAYVSSQGFGGPNGAAALVDLAGDDVYRANDEDIRFPSPQNTEHNVSMCQGAASGERADYLDGLSINGGVGILLDAAGDDVYTCGVFGQGVGYWFGLGMLIDLAGEDTYTGHWYVQGASAHFAAGLLFDRQGADRYLAAQNMSQGAGHDVGIGVFVDDAGDDDYTASTLGLGASNAAGIGIFVDKAGNDTYRTPTRACVGWVNPNTAYRGLFRSYGLFFDLGGADAYGGRDDGPGREGMGESRQWETPTADGLAGRNQLGFGFDLNNN